MSKTIQGRSARKPASRVPSSKPGIPGGFGGKTRLTMYLDTVVVEYFRLRSGGRGYQTLINETLRQAMERENLEDTLRRVIREEARAYRVEED